MLHNAAQGDQLPIIVRELLAAHNTKSLFSSSDHLRYRQGPTATARCLRDPIRASGSRSVRIATKPCSLPTKNAGPEKNRARRVLFGSGDRIFELYANRPRPVSVGRLGTPLLLTTGRILSQYNVGAQTRRTPNVVWYDEDLLEIHPSDAELRGVKDGELVSLISRKGDITLRATITTKVQPGVVYTTFHNPETGANVVTTEYSDWATDCPEYKVTAVQVAPAQHRSTWQHGFDENAKRQGKILETT
ncbi:MAG: hypothetical protein IID58_04000 [Proteobacteria bacterium]|nr:hypothetical protein [Pseudomonadota bacterium]